MNSKQEPARPVQAIGAARPPESKDGEQEEEVVKSPLTLTIPKELHGTAEHDHAMLGVPSAEEDSGSNYEQGDEEDDFYGLIDSAYGHGESGAYELPDEQHESSTDSHSFQQQYVDEVQEAEKRRSHWGLGAFDFSSGPESTLATRLLDLDDFFQDPEEEDLEEYNTKNGTRHFGVEGGPLEVSPKDEADPSKAFHARSSSLAAADAIEDSLLLDETENKAAAFCHRRALPVVIKRNTGTLDLATPTEKMPQNDVETNASMKNEHRYGGIVAEDVNRKTREVAAIVRGGKRQEEKGGSKGLMPPYEMREKDSSKSLKQKALNIVEEMFEAHGGMLPQLEPHHTLRAGSVDHVCSEDCCHAHKGLRPVGPRRVYIVPASETPELETPVALPKKSVDLDQSDDITGRRRPSVASSTKARALSSIKDEFRENVHDLVIEGRKRRGTQETSTSKSGFLQKIKSMENFRIRPREKVYTSNEETPEIPIKYRKHGSGDSTGSGGPISSRPPSRGRERGPSGKSSTKSSAEERNMSSVRKLLARVKPQRRPTIELNTTTPFLDGKPLPDPNKITLDIVQGRGRRSTPRSRPVQEPPPDAIIYSAGNLSPTRNNGWGVSRRLEAHDPLPTVSSHQVIFENTPSPVTNIWANNPKVGHTLPAFAQNGASPGIGDPLRNAQPAAIAHQIVAGATEGGSPIRLERLSNNATTTQRTLEGSFGPMLPNETLAETADGPITGVLQPAQDPQNSMGARYLQMQMSSEVTSATHNQKEPIVEGAVAERAAERVNVRLQLEKATLIGRLEGLERRLAALEGLEARTVALEANYPKFKDRVTAPEARLSALETLETRTTALEGRVESRAQAVETLMQAVEAINAALTGRVETRFQALEELTASLDARFPAAEAHSATVQAPIENLLGLGELASTSELP